MFHSARLKLTAWYVLIAFIITLLFSLLAYNGFRFEFEQGLQRQRVFFQQSLTPNGQPVVVFRRTDPDLMQDLRIRLMLRILYIDGAIILVAAIGGYLLAGRTLKPIQQMVDEQNRFITDASHELRTPLTALRSELEATLLSKNLEEKEARSVLKSNLEEVVNLQNLSDNLLELAIQKKSKPTLTQELSLLTIVEDAIKKVMPLAKKKRMIIENKVTDLKIAGQKEPLTELFIILLDNAIKYSNSETMISLSSKTKEKNANITVTDQGIGISNQDQEKIFDRFYRTDKSRSKSKSTTGYGLGLSIAKRIVADHNGTIVVKSKLGAGTTFTVSLPTK